jgi:hypothetical protein
MIVRVAPIGLAVSLLLIAPGQSVQAARLRFHYAAGCQGSTAAPVQASAACTERLSWFGTVTEPYSGRLPRPPQYISYCHPYTGQAITLPVALPEGTPRIEHRGSRLVYNYGSYVVEVQFFPNGSAEVIYNPGPFRCP